MTCKGALLNEIHMNVHCIKKTYITVPYKSRY